ncbi:MAG: ABC transporter ATP-binding protein [Phycisphaerales bacterium]|nr:ABC transporter ATP-binding protein [Phycisphaerales bacterium]
MSPPPRSSRRRFRDYLERVRKRIGARALDQEITTDTPAEGPKPRRRARTFAVLLRAFLGQVAPHRWRLVAALGALTIGTCLALVPPAATKFVIDYVFDGKPVPPAWKDLLPLPTAPRERLTWICIGLCVVVLVQLVVQTWSRWNATSLSKRLQSDLRRKVFEHAVRLPLHRVYALKSGGVASILREDAGGVGELVFSMIYNPWRAIIQLAGSLTILAFTDWRLLLGSLLVIPAVYYSHRTWISRIRPVYRDIRAQRQSIDSHATEAFGGMRIVRAFARQRSETGRFTRGTHLMARQELLVWWWSRGLEIVWQLLIPVASAALLWYGGLRVLDGAISVGDLVMFLAYLVLLLGPLEALVSSATQFQGNLAGLDRVLDLLEEPREMPDAPDAVRLVRSEVRGHLTVRSVTFQYPGSDEHVLEDVSFEARSGQMIALVGPSGAGKTTLCNLIARFHDPTRGSISLDGRDLRQIQLDSYRTLLGVVEQDVFLFDGTIAENIAYAARHAPAERIHAAAQAANADAFIEAMPDGYATLIGERGVRLSGGQRQRIAIARALLADPRILILDEATSSLDTESERLIQQSLARLMKGRTSFVIAHRLSTIAHADLILVLEHGRIVETGSHDELMAASGRYRQMVLLQVADRDRTQVGV